MSHLTDRPLDAAAVLERVADPARGATVLFLGTVRGVDRGRTVTGIDYSAYEPMAELVLARIEAELAAVHEGLAVAIVHRLGRLAAGEASIAIAASSPRRDAAFEASRRALERVKREAPIWKLECYADGSSAWREEEPLTAGSPAAPAD